MKKKRRKYTQEFKEEAVKLVTEQGYQIAEAARNLGVNERSKADLPPSSFHKPGLDGRYNAG